MTDENTDKLKKDVQESKYKIEQLENEIMTAKDMELTRLIYTVLENKGQNSQNNSIRNEENQETSIEKRNNMYNILSSQLSDLLKINRINSEYQSSKNNKINNYNLNNFEEVDSLKNELEEKKGEIINLNEKIKELTDTLKKRKKY